MSEYNDQSYGIGRPRPSRRDRHARPEDEGIDVSVTEVTFDAPSEPVRRSDGPSWPATCRGYCRR